MRRSPVHRRSAEPRRRLEVLETRSVMAITCALADGTLTVCGTDPSDQVALVAHAEGETIHVLDSANSIVASYNAAEVRQIEVQSAGGADAVRYDAALASLVSISDTSGSSSVATPAPPVRSFASETVGHQHGVLETHSHASGETHTETPVAETPVQETTKSTAPVVPAAQMLVALPVAPTTTATINTPTFSQPTSSASVTVATDNNTSSVHSHGSAAPQVMGAAPTAGDAGHEGHGETEGGITSATAATVAATSITNPIVSTAMSGTTIGGGRTSSSEGAKSCELKTSFKGASRTLYTKYECKCDEKRWAKRTRAAAVVVDDESGPKNMALRGPLSLIWDGGFDTCTDSNHALEEFERMQQEYADEAAEAVLPLDSADEAPAAEEAETNYFQVLGMSLLSVGVVGLAATRVPSARKRDEEEERALFLSLELLTR